MDAWRRRFSEALLDYLLIFTELRLEELSSFSKKLERTAISMKSLSLRSKGLLFCVGPPSGAGLSSGNLSVIDLDLQYLLILNSVSAIIEVFSWPILTWRNDYNKFYQSLNSYLLVLSNTHQWLFCVRYLFSSWIFPWKWLNLYLKLWLSFQLFFHLEPK